MTDTNHGRFKACCPNCRASLVMMPYRSAFVGTEWTGLCPNGHHIQLRASKVAPPEDGGVEFDPPSISIKNSKLGGKKR